MPRFGALVISLEGSSGVRPLDHNRQVDRQLKTQLIRVLFFHSCIVLYILDLLYIEFSKYINLR